MLPIGLNHMTAPTSGVLALLDMAKQVGCVGVELRNDLGGDFLDGLDPRDVRDAAAGRGLRVLALAEVKAFNRLTQDTLGEAEQLMRTAAACGAEAVALIPEVGRAPVERDSQRQALRDAVRLLHPLLQQYGLTGLIEPIGFLNSSLRFKADVVAVLDELGCPSCFAMIHDTFHHHLAGETAVYPDLTGLVHISGVADTGPDTDQMADAHRVLVDDADRLGNIAQLRKLVAGGYTGPASFEAFAPETHNTKHPVRDLARSIEFITTQMAEEPA